MEKWPPELDRVAFEVFFTEMLAPDIGSPVVLLNTFPVIFRALVCEKLCKPINRKDRSIHTSLNALLIILFFFIADNFEVIKHEYIVDIFHLCFIRIFSPLYLTSTSAFLPISNPIFLSLSIHVILKTLFFSIPSNSPFLLSMVNILVCSL